jgi:hypothetical protein
MIEISQQELLGILKKVLGVTWNQVAERTEISPRALKSYRLPSTSKGARGMHKRTRRAVEKILKRMENKV